MPGDNVDDSHHSYLPLDSHSTGRWQPFLADQSFCYHCKKLRTRDGNSLKRCTGCGVAMYCDRDCQKAAWPFHRRSCRSSNSIQAAANPSWYNELGYTTQFSLEHTVKEWMEIHYHTLKIMTQIALYTSGGVNHNLAAPYTMVFVLEALSDSSGNKLHPSRAFRIIDAEIFHRNRNRPALDVLWGDEHVRERERVLRHWQSGKNPFSRNPALAGAFPTAFMVKGVTRAWYHSCDVYHPSRHAGDAPPDELTRLAFTDLETICARAIRGGLILEAPEDYTQIPPPGATVYQPRRNGSGWKKISLRPDILANSIAHDRVVRADSYVSRLPWEKIWEVYKHW